MTDRTGRVLLAIAASVVLLLAGLFHTLVAHAATGNVTTAAYGNLRDSWDANEPSLGPSAVQSAGFGKLFVTKLGKGAIFSQPLVYNGDVIVTTEEAKAYAVNATTGAIVWQRSFGTPLKSATAFCEDLKPLEGSTSTPVIDPSTGIIYLTTHTLPSGKQQLEEVTWELQAISAETGAEEPGYPVQIEGTPNNTPGVPFNISHQQQRPGLLLMNGVVYMGFGSDCDNVPYRGIVVGVSIMTHKITTMWSDESGAGTDENSQAGIWQGGGGLVSAAPGNIILATGNGVSPVKARSNTPPATLSESVINLAVEGNGELKPTQFFAPSNAPNMDVDDEDLGSGGPIALPTEYFGTKAIPHLLVEVGKDGRIFLINAENMGGYREGPGETDAVLQTVGPFAGVWGHPAVYGGQGGYVYVLESSGGGNLQALSYGLNGEGLPALTPAATSSETFGYTSGSPLVTSNGTTSGSAVVWGIYTNSELGGKGQLRAYSAIPSGGNLKLLWTGKLGKASKFASPTAWEGRVYVGNRKGQLYAFGPSADAPIQAKPLNLGAVPVGRSRTTTLSLSVIRELEFTAHLSATGERSVTASEPNIHTGAPIKPVKPSGDNKLKTAGPRIPPPSGQISIDKGVIKIQQPHLKAAIAAGSTERLHVTFSPDAAGPVTGLISIPTNAGVEAVTVSGYGVKPGLVTSVKPLSFGSVSTNSGGKALAITFSNSWSHPETVTGVRVPKGPYTVTGLPPVGTLLAPRQAVTVSVRFNPSNAGTYSSHLRISTNHGSVTLPATGTAVKGSPHLSVSTRAVDFGSVRVGDSKSLKFKVTDIGPIPVTITRAIPPGDPFSATVPLPEGISIENGLSATVTVTFRPTTTGPASSTYVIAGNDHRGYMIVKLEGTGT